MDAAIRRALDAVTRRFETAIAAAVKRVERRIGNMIAVAVIENVNAGTKFQTLKGTAFEDDTDDSIVLFEQGGIRHVMLPGAECLTFSVGGKGANRAAIGASKRGDAPTDLSPGDTCIYTSGPLGARIVCKALGDVVVIPGPLCKIKLGGEDVSGSIAIAEKVHLAIAAMLKAGIGATGTQAFAAAALVWEGTSAPPIPGPPPPAMPVPLNVGSAVIQGD